MTHTVLRAAALFSTKVALSGDVTVASNPEVVAILSHDDGLVERLREALRRAGLRPVSWRAEAGADRAHLNTLVRTHDPHVIVYDVAAPYDREWRALQQLQESPECAGRVFVIASTNPKRIAELAGAREEIFEAGTPQDVDRLTDAVRQAVRSRPVR